eukprot:CAMPEP_0168336834 /NCGR_PEP_ID=MMETSP0213-20121227/11798_1 /TAXON_ID=151035 /ORGANISM="Euplotes harpa, Strain FSP1.4" /LENGTH=49 /DNA_ID= /DNA_START= /DNA_END= /DNA_ORIENTATION=
MQRSLGFPALLLAPAPFDIPETAASAQLTLASAEQSRLMASVRNLDDCH